MSCADRKDAILLYAFDQLEADEAAPLLAHIRSGCPTCIGALAAARTIAGELALAAPPAVPSSSVRARVLAATAVRRPARWPAIAATALLAAGLAGFAILVPARRGVERMRAEVREARQETRDAEARAATAEEKLRALGSPDTRVFAMGPAGPQPDASARIFWDESRGTWQVFVSRMKVPPPGSTYQLWFITPDDRKVPAGTFGVNASGEARVDVTIPKGLGAIAVAAVTEEPEGGVPQPTGAIQLVGKLGV